MVRCLHTPKQRIPSHSLCVPLVFEFHFRVSWFPVSIFPPLALPFLLTGVASSASAVLGVSAAAAVNAAAVIVAGVATDIASAAALAASVAAAGPHIIAPVTAPFSLAVGRGTAAGAAGLGWF
jgi:hypothetical protein